MLDNVDVDDILNESDGSSTPEESDNSSQEVKPSKPKPNHESCSPPEEESKDEVPSKDRYDEAEAFPDFQNPVSDDRGGPSEGGQELPSFSSDAANQIEGEEDADGTIGKDLVSDVIS